MNTRGVAAGIISKWLQTGKFPDRLLQGVGVNHAFVMELVYGSVRWKRLLEWLVKRHARRVPGHVTTSFLFVGLYQIFFMEDVEIYAAVNETVEASKKKCGKKTTAFINAVLRKAADNKQALQSEMGDVHPAVRMSHPDMLVHRWSKRFGIRAMERLCAWNNSRPGVTVFANGIVASESDLAHLFDQGDVEYERVDFEIGSGFRIGVGRKVQDLPGYSRGAFIVADPSTLYAVKLVDPSPGDNILDACAAPGGKTVMMASLMGRTGTIVARDIHQDRLALLQDTLKRCRCDFVKTEKADARKTGNSQDKFNKILIDAPCTNTGVIRRRPDARWRFSMDTLRKAVEGQYAVLEALCGYLRPGGRIVYSTCSLEDEENALLVDKWLKKHPEFKKENEYKIVPPGKGVDGAYAALLVHSG